MGFKSAKPTDSFIFNKGIVPAWLMLIPCRAPGFRDTPYKISRPETKKNTLKQEGKVIEFEMNGAPDSAITHRDLMAIKAGIRAGIKHRISQRNSNSFRSIGNVSE